MKKMNQSLSVFWSARWIRWILVIVIPVLCAMFVNRYGVCLSVVQGISMQPTLMEGDRLLVNKFHFLWATPKRGEVVTFHDPHQENRLLVKRIIGIPGDVVTIRQGRLFCNGKLVHEQYVNTPIADGNFGPLKVKKGTVFVMGDNRHRYASRDSRYPSVGLVPVSLIAGKVEWILWRPSLSAHL